MRARLLTEPPEIEVLLDRQFWQKMPPLRHENHASRDDFLGRQADEIDGFTIDPRDDGASRRAKQAHHAFHQRALAVSIRAEQCDRLALTDDQRHVIKRAHMSVSGRKIRYREAIPQD